MDWNQNFQLGNSLTTNFKAQVIDKKNFQILEEAKEEKPKKEMYSYLKTDQNKHNSKKA